MGAEMQAAVAPAEAPEPFGHESGHVQATDAIKCSCGWRTTGPRPLREFAAHAYDAGLEDAAAKLDAEADAHALSHAEISSKGHTLAAAWHNAEAVRRRRSAAAIRLLKRKNPA